MSKNMKDSLRDFIRDNPAELAPDENGFTLLHKETIAGNRSSVEVLLQAGASVHIKTNEGKTALDFAQELAWDHIIPLLK